jgi:hypothetical protein
VHVYFNALSNNDFMHVYCNALSNNEFINFVHYMKTRFYKLSTVNVPLVEKSNNKSVII